MTAGDHPIVAVAVGSATVAQQMVATLFDQGVLATAFVHPAVPEHQALIRLQLTAGHTDDDLTTVVQALVAARQAARGFESAAEP